MKRIFYFLVTNLAIVLVLSITMRLLGVEPFLNANGLNLNSLLIFAAVMGFGGACIIGSDGGLIVSGPKGSYSLNKDDKVFASPNIDKPGSSNNSGISGDLILRKIDELINVVKQGGDVILDGNKVGQALVLNNYRMQ
jgi:hypothetical protein